MDQKTEIIDIIYSAMDNIKDMVSDSSNFKKDPQTILYGQDSALDSMAMVGLIIAVEDKINQKFGNTIVLANEKAVSMKNSPFKSVESLAEYAAKLLQE